MFLAIDLTTHSSIFNRTLRMDYHSVFIKQNIDTDLLLQPSFSITTRGIRPGSAHAIQSSTIMLFYEIIISNVAVGVTPAYL